MKLTTIQQTLMSFIVFACALVIYFNLSGSEVFAEAKCYQSDGTTLATCLTPIGGDASSIDGGIITIQDGKCYKYGSDASSALQLEEFACPQVETNNLDPPKCYTGINSTIDCSEVPDETPGDEWRRPISFQKGACYREISATKWATDNGLSNPGGYTGAVWVRVNCNDLGAVESELDCIDSGLCRDQVAEARNSNTSNNDSNDNNEPTCEGSVEGVGWLICSAINGMLDGMGVLERSIQGQLRVDLDTISGNGSASAENANRIRSSNQSMVVIANMAFAIGVLWVVISQAITGGGGGGILSAYEAKKILPKLIAAIIVANFSWDLVNLCLKISNSIGDSVKSIMLAPFQDAAGFGSITIGTWDSLLITGAGLTAVGLAAFGFFAVSPILLMAFLSILIGYFALIFRKVAIIILVTFSPIVLAISPFAPGISKKWFTMLRNMILMYPAIMAIFAGFTIMSYLINSSADAASGIPKAMLKLAAIAALFAGGFMIVPLFKSIGGVIGKVGGSLQNAGNKWGRQFGQRRLEGNQRKMDRDIKRQTDIGLKKANRQRRRTGIITRKMDRAKEGNAAYNAAYQNAIASGDNKAQAWAKAEKAKRAIMLKKGVAQLPQSAIDRNLRGKFNKDDKRAKSGYESQVALQSIEEGYKNADAEAEFVFDGKGKAEAQAIARNIAMDFSGHDQYQRRAAIKKLIQLKATDELGQVMDAHMQSTDGQEQWNNLLASDQFATIKGHDASLTMPYQPVSGNPAQTQQAKQEAQLASYSGINSGNLLTMQGNAAWQRYRDTMQYAEQQSQNAALTKDERADYQAKLDKMKDTVRLAHETIDKTPSVLSSADSNAAKYVEGLHTGNPGVIPTPPTPSDYRLKRDIKATNNKYKGATIYKFKYIGDSNNEEYIGLMAQDLLDIPELEKYVVKMDNGFYGIDYHALGFDFRKTREQERG